jgi:hypothetical protein
MDATAKKLRLLLRRCVVCQQDFFDHSYALFATTIFGEEGKVSEILRLLEEHEWVSARGFQDWKAVADDIEVYAIRCKLERIVLLTIYSPHELYESDRLIRCESLNPEDSRKLENLIEHGQWHAFNS